MAPTISIDMATKSLAPKSISFCTATKANPLNFASRWVWSYLVKCERARGQGASVKEIRKWTGLGRQAVELALAKLIECKLAEKIRRYETTAKEPVGESASWWAKRPPKNPGAIAHWADSIGFFRVNIGDGAVLDSVLLGLLRSLAKKTKAAKSQCYLGLARMLGIKDYRTVKASIERLKTAGKIEITGISVNRFKKTDRFDVLLKDLAAKGGKSDSGSIPSTSAAPETTTPNGTMAEGPTVPMTPIERIRHDKNCMRRMMRNHNYPEHVIGTVLGLTDKFPLEKTFDIFQVNFSSAEEDHQTQQSQGKYLDVKHSGNLLLHNLDKVIKKGKEADRRWAEQMAGYESMTACV